MTLDPVHRSLVVVDIEDYSRRLNQGHLDLRKALRQILDEAFDSVGIEIIPGEQQDQGDAFLTLVKPDVSKVALLDKLVRELENALRRCNRYRANEERIRLRVALHSGEVHVDGTGFPGVATVTAMRLVDAEQLKKALRMTTKDLAVIVSDSLYRDVVVHGYGAIIPEEYGRVDVAVKQFNQSAWIRVPGCFAEDVGLGTRSSESPAKSPSGNEPKVENKPPIGGEGSFNNAYFAGPTSFGGYAAGRDINLNRRGYRNE